MAVFIVVVVVSIALVLVLAAAKPNTFRVRRTATIRAQPQKIFALINDFHAWRAWSPYEKLDPAMKRELSGAKSGRGAIYTWESRGKAGVGRMEITDSVPAAKVTIQLTFIKPFAGRNIAEFTLAPHGDSTEVTWEMHGAAPFLSKVIQVFVEMDRLVGKDFEVGLANLQVLGEAERAEALEGNS